MFVFAQGSTDVTVYIVARDSTTNEGKTGLVFNTANLVCRYTRPRAAATAITLATLAAVDSAHADGGFKEIDATNAKGLYRLDLPDAAAAAGASYVIISLGGAAGTLFEHLIVLLDPLSDVIIGTVTTDAGNSATAFETDLASATSNFYKDMWLLILTGALAGQVKKVTGYNGATKIITVEALTATPADGVRFALVNR